MKARISTSLLIFAGVLIGTWFAIKPRAAGSPPAHRSQLSPQLKSAAKAISM